eukprot:scpid70030/ scgid22106/ 
MGCVSSAQPHELCMVAVPDFSLFPVSVSAFELAAHQLEIRCSRRVHRFTVPLMQSCLVQVFPSTTSKVWPGISHCSFLSSSLNAVCPSVSCPRTVDSTLGKSERAANVVRFVLHFHAAVVVMFNVDRREA